ncbi:HTTM domain-containing protein [Halorubrum sp. 48-1-W]|uniref:HTTM domain-containing protein n=1 Tax=Halorubrum sp. 48-1-W TaxID=2249761 RepID=UPI000DCEBBD7|nr:HTTM domain-containing protein [Halorubrum sp. 48-1-W]RAW44244.1 HTTM domain-containing protein [Halorubrum sp. 48-1-W]
MPSRDSAPDDDRDADPEAPAVGDDVESTGDEPEGFVDSDDAVTAGSDEATVTSGNGLERAWERLSPVLDRVRKRFEVDTRSLAAVRIALGLVILLDLLHRSQDLALFYTDAGVYPVAAYEATYGQYTGMSLHALSGDLWFQGLLFVVAGAFAVAFLLGYRTRLVGVVSLLLLFSLQARNPALLNGGDRLFRVLLAVALVTPLGERWSVDALRRGSARTAVASFGTAALLAQPVVVFTSNAIAKHAGEEWYAGDGLTIALHNEVMTTALGKVLADFPTLLTLLNYGWVTLLSGSALFLLATVGRVRMVAALVYTSAFVGMLLTMAVGLFPLLLMTSMLPFMPAVFWETCSRRVPSAWTERLPSTSAVAAALGPLGRPPIERRVLDPDREGWYGEASDYTIAYGRSLLTVIGFCVLVWMLVFSAATVGDYDVPAEIDYDHLDQQKWGLYAPDPSESYSWYPSRAYLANGSTTNAFGGGELTFDRPPDPAAEYPNFRHRKFMSAVDSSGPDGSIAESYADWVCERAQESHDAPVDSVTVYQVYQSSPIDGEYEDPGRQIVIEHDCPAG